MFNSFSAALSALKAHSAAVDTVGHNLANVNTTGYKAMDVAFKDVVAQSMSGHSETGMGVGRVATVRNFSQGAIQSSSGPLDTALQGSGFFVVTDAAGNKMFTRDGSFQLDASGNVVTVTGEKVQQYTSAGLSSIQVPTGAVAATPTTAVNVIANLNATAAVGDKFSTPVEVVDSLGARHTLTFQFTKNTDNKWNYDILVPATDIGGTGVPKSIFASAPSTTFDFDSSGKLTAPALAGSPIALTVTPLANKAADIKINWNLYDTAGAPTMTQFAQASAVSRTDQNGYAAAEITSVGMADGGRVMARFANGQEKEIAKLAIALVLNPSSLTSASDNNFKVGEGSASPVYGTAETGGRGKVKANALEASTVDIAREFTNLIVYQRGYQANSRVITTTDELTQETLNLKR
ncbi:MAG: flagellar hook protein FlgE [Bryobacteraceae bacterium]|nr:flagellar hook protein FlgE [Bryobacteraceae bacterium]